MPDLEMLLRDVRPTPDPVWAATLDERVTNRFSRPPARWRAPFAALREHFFAFGALATVSCAVLAVIVLAVSTDRSSNDDSASSGSSMPVAESDSRSDSSAKAPSSGSGTEAPLSAPVPSSTVVPEEARDRAVKKSTAITLTTTPDEVQSVSDAAIRVVDNLGGYVDSSSTSITGSHAEATLSLRIPAAKLDDGLTRLSKLAPVSSRSQETQDLTDQRAYLEARVRDARSDRNGLRIRLGKATTDKERSSLRAQLDRATRTVTRRERAVASLGQEVAYGTVDLTIKGRKKSGGAAAAKPGDRWTPGDALHDAGRVLEVIAGVILIALAILLPLAVLGVLTWIANRTLTRRRRLRALEMA